MLAVGDVQAARDAAGELTEIAERYDTPALRAVADHARGAVLLAEGDARAAVVALRGAWQAWRELEAPYEAARVRVLVGLGCRALGDEEAAAMELEAARDACSPSSAPHPISPGWRRSPTGRPPGRRTG